MDKELFAIQSIKQQGVLPLFFHTDISVCTEVVQTLYAAGIRCIEFTNRTDNALANFSEMINARDNSMKDLLLGIGTIKTAKEASAFIDAGADFLVSPFFDNEICDAAYMNKILWIPGCMTATEIHTAQKAGCTLIKLFPGNVLGPSFVETVAPLFNGIDFMITGGVDATEESIKSWFKAGASAVGIGGKLVSKEVLEKKDYAGLGTKAKELIEIIKKIKSTQ